MNRRIIGWKPIGGFFEFEIAEGNDLYHNDAIKLTTGRACLNYALKVIKPGKIYLPFYCCNALYEPISLNGIDYEFYSIDAQLEIENLPELKNNEIIIYTDFFGIKSSYTRFLASQYSDSLLIDNSHSFFQKQEYPDNFTFTSARKYFGVPDGAFLYAPTNQKTDMTIKRNTDISIDHNILRLLGAQSEAFQKYKDYEKKLGSEIERISIFSEKVLSTLDYEKIRTIRERNFKMLHKQFGEQNRLNIDSKERDPFCYPFLPETPLKKSDLYEEQIYIPNLWGEILNRETASEYPMECTFSIDIAPIPIDHRYGVEDMERLILQIDKQLNK